MSDDGPPPLHEVFAFADDDDDGVPPLEPIVPGPTVWQAPVVYVDPDYERRYIFMWAMQQSEYMLPMELTLMIMAHITLGPRYQCACCREKADVLSFYRTTYDIAYCSQACWGAHTYRPRPRFWDLPEAYRGIN